MQVSLAMLWSDWLIWGLFLIAALVCFWMRKQPNLREPWRQITRRKIAMSAMVVLSFFLVITLLDSIHLNLSTANKKGQISAVQTKSILDLLISPLGSEQEKTYSAPFATHLYSQSLTTLPNGKEVRTYAPLKYVDANQPITKLILIGFIEGTLGLLILFAIIYWIHKRKKSKSSNTAWGSILTTFSIIWIASFILGNLAVHYHILGTDKVGQDVFYETIKSIRTGVLIGTLTTLFMLPFALILGTLAGYFRGWVDDLIQYIYTTLSSIPGVLLISAAVLVLQVYIASHPKLFPTLIDRADARLLALCFILGITTWASLCRLLRAETLKLRSLEYVQAARALGVGHFKIIQRHIIPNVMHIVLITLVLDFSMLVLAEAVLSYVGVGVDPTTMSWGNMINSSRLELAREPLVWWPLVAALIFMFLLVLSANLFSDAVRDAYDPRLRNLD